MLQLVEEYPVLADAINGAEQDMMLGVETWEDAILPSAKMESRKEWNSFYYMQLTMTSQCHS